MDAIWQALKNTPWWVFFLFFYLMKVGLDATKTTVVSLKKLFILPIVFLVVSINTLVTSVQVNALTLGTYLFSLFCGVVGGWILVKNFNLQFDKRRGLVKLPGSWITLILILVIFLAKYYFGYSLATDPTKAEDTIFEISMLSVSGACTGLFLGRLSNYLYKRRLASHQDLK